MSNENWSLAMADNLLDRGDGALGAPHGRMPERPKGAVCKIAGDAYGGSNPPPPTTACSRNSAPSVLEIPLDRSLWAPSRVQPASQAPSAEPPSSRSRDPGREGVCQGRLTP